MNLSDRLLKLRQRKGVSQIELSQNTNLTVGEIQEIEISSDASLRQLITISNYFKADLNWFIMGAGYEQMEMDYIVLIDTQAAAGYLENKDDPTYFSQLEYFRIPGFDKEGNHRIFLVHGHSMHPTLSESDHLVCSEVKDLKDLENGDLAVFVTDTDIVVKRVRFDNGTLILESDNPKFHAYTIENSKIDEIWRVEGKVTRLIEQISSQKSDVEDMAKEMKKMQKQISSFREELKRLKEDMGSREK